MSANQAAQRRRVLVGKGALYVVCLLAAGWIGRDWVHPPMPPMVGAENEIRVMVQGAVARPGVYTLPRNGRVEDAVKSAGGLLGSADRDQVNLAARLRDEEPLVIPEVGEQGTGAAVYGLLTPLPEREASAGPVAGIALNLNTATRDELDTLPGIGPKTADAIMAHRARIGGFQSVEQLEDVKGIGPKKLARLRPLVKVGN
ncbi:MAG: helix-hairpin-helix domain-containing protein [Fimbriimonadaceae bacterium]|nr:helix-hairpin-helix domain-containing protein [Fimbriimonadaceae bacterium]